MTDTNGNGQQDDRVDSGEWVDCPHCHDKILIQFKSKCWIQKVETPSESSTPPSNSKVKEWRDGLSQQQNIILDQAIRSGLLDSFVSAMERGSHNGVPKNKEKYFIEWLRLSKRKIVPAWALAEFQELYPGTFIEFHVSNMVGAVVSNGEIVLFVPVNLISGVTLKSDMNGSKRIGSPDASGIKQWVRTKMGYVPQEARIALAETRKRSIGEYANPVL